MRFFPHPVPPIGSLIFPTLLVSILTMLAFIEYVPLMILTQFISIGLYLAMMKENPAQITYLLYTLFSMVCQSLWLLKKLLL